jgi:hypothetical protein
MMEGEAKEISEAEMIAAMKAGHAEVVKIIDAQHELRRKLGLADKVIVDNAEPSAEPRRRPRTAGPPCRGAADPRQAGARRRQGGQDRHQGTPHWPPSPK